MVNVAAQETIEERRARNASYVRDHLANERTFLAWLRTSVALMSFGVFIVKLRYLVPASPQNHGAVDAMQLGLSFAVLGLAMIVYALSHYFAVRRAIDADCYKSAGVEIVVFAVAVACIGIAIVVYLLNSSVPLRAR